MVGFVTLRLEVEVHLGALERAEVLLHVPRVDVRAEHEPGDECRVENLAAPQPLENV